MATYFNFHVRKKKTNLSKFRYFAKIRNTQSFREQFIRSNTTVGGGGGIPNASLSGFNQYWWVQKEEKRLNVVLFAFDPLSKELHRDRANVVLAH